MEYKGDLYGKVGGKYFKTGKTSDDWDKLENNKLEWINVKETLPKENELVWACNNNTGFIALACLVYDLECGWSWAASDGEIYTIDGIITGECECDDYDFTHWQKLPKLPAPDINDVSKT